MNDVLELFLSAAHSGRPLAPEQRLLAAAHAEALGDLPPAGLGVFAQHLLLAPFAPVALSELAYSGAAACLLPELIPCLGFPGDQQFHRHALFEHLLEVVRLTPPRPALRWAALFHDVGKPWTRARAPDGRIHFYGHDQLGAEMLRLAGRRLALPAALTEAAAQLVARHMFSFEMGAKGMRRLQRELGAERLTDLLDLKLADLVGTGGLHVPQAVDAYWAFRHALAEATAAPTGLTVRDLAVDGDDVMTVLAIPPGPAVGHVLAELLARVQVEPALNRRDVLLGLLRNR